MAFSFARTNAEKVDALLAWLQTPDVAAFAQLRHTAQQLRKRGGGRESGPYYQVVEERSRALQRRLGEILRRVAYEGAADSPWPRHWPSTGHATDNWAATRPRAF